MDILLIVTFFVALLSSIVSGMSGGGGGFIMTPYFLFIGFTPQQIVANASIASLGLGGSSLIAMRGRGLIQTKFLWPLLAVTFVATVLAALVLPKVKGDTFEIAIAAFLILLAPTLFIKKQSFQPGERTRGFVLAGYITYAVLLFVSALGSGLATLLFLPLMFLMGLSALKANALRRVLMLLQAVLMFCMVLPQGYIVWSYALTTLAGCWIGGFIGTKIALQKGEIFVKYALASIMVISGVALLL